MSANITTQILIVEDEPAHVEMISHHLQLAGYSCLQVVSTLESCLQQIKPFSPHIILVDLHLPDGGAMELLKEVEGQIPVITMTSRGTEEQAVEVLKAGALDYLTKSAETFAAIPRIVERALREWQLQRANQQALEKIRQHQALTEALLQNTATPIFVIDSQHRVLVWNKACEQLTGVKVQEVVGTDRHWSGFYAQKRPCLIDVLLDESSPEVLSQWYPEHSRSELLKESLQAEGWRSGADGEPIYLTFNAALVRDTKGCVIAAIETLQDITPRKKMEDELEQANREIKQAHLQQLQSGKMASIGQLAAGVAHEINNPIGFVTSNLGSLEKYLAKLKEFISFQDQELATQANQETLERVTANRKQLKIDFTLADIDDLLAESRDGVDRVGKIIRDLKRFSRVDEAEYKMADVIECLESSINIVWNEVKYKAVLNRDFAELPEILCFPGQLNQVFVNLLVNAAQAIETQGTIDLKTWADEDAVYIRISDSGCGISEQNCQRIFEPFFTTKEVGKGTGLGLSITYDIIKKHQGDIQVESQIGAGTSFTIMLPIRSEESKSL